MHHNRLLYTSLELLYEYIYVVFEAGTIAFIIPLLSPATIPPLHTLNSQCKEMSKISWGSWEEGTHIDKTEELDDILRKIQEGFYTE